MKRVALSAVVIFAFLAYAAHSQLEGSGSVVVVPPPEAVLSNQTTQPSQNNGTVPAQNSGSAQSNNSAGSQSALTQNMPGQGAYKDGQYTGSIADAFYGNVQVKVTISGGKITDVQFLDYPHDRGTSIEINSQAMPYLKQEAIAAQSASVDIVSGATQTSGAFQISLASALAQAH